MEQQHVLLPEMTRQRLEEFRSQVRAIKLAEGVLAGLFGLAFSYLVVFGLDRFIDTPALMRGLILIGGALGFGLFLPLKCHRWLWGTRRMEQVAILVKQTFPRLGDQLLGVVELARNEDADRQSSSLTLAAIKQVDDVVRDQDLSGAVPQPRHKAWAGTAAIPMVLMLLALVLVPAAGKNALARWLMPWQQTDRYTFTQIEELPDEMVVPHGEEFSITALLADSTRWTPQDGTAQVDSLRKPIAANLNERKYQFVIPAQTEDQQVHLAIGDLKKSIKVNTETRPELSEMQATVHLPAYLQYSHPLSLDVRGGVVSVLKGAEVQFAAEVNRNLNSAEVDGATSSIDGQQIFTQPISVTDSRTLPFRWQDHLGLTSKDDLVLKINAVEDEQPNVSCHQTEVQQVVLSTDVVKFELNTDDDFGLKKVGLEWQGIADPLRNPNPDNGEKIVALGGPEQKEISAFATFSAESDKVRPQSLQIRAFAEDYKESGERAYSPMYVLHVMTPDEHAVWMTNQLRRWASRADDIYEEEIRLHDENRAIRRMSPEEMALPNTQRRIEQQAAAERANAARLGAVTDQGDQLIEQALRNPEMLVGHLETWAQVLKQLRGISDQKMPTVADLLNKAAQAKSAPKKPGGQGNQNPAAPKPSAGNNRSEQTGSGEAPPKKGNPPPTPSLIDIESGFNKPNEKDGENKDEKPKQAKPGKFGLPQTVLQGGPPQEKKPEGENEEDAPEELNEAIETQEDLLAEFALLRDQLQAILDDLENSTFVKRFKAASRKQLDVATDLNRTLFDSFGMNAEELVERDTEKMTRIADNELSQSRNLWTIQSDLEAYFGRKREEKFRKILDEMEELDAIHKLSLLSETIQQNHSGESISRAEFWADTLDRWAEELVSPSKCGSCKGCKGDSLPPSIVLEVLRIIEGEMDLRDETRSLEQTKAAIESQEFVEKAGAQAETQEKLHERTLNVLKDIRALPEGSQKFAKELQMIEGASYAMNDATEILNRPDTGPEAIAAETEAIELLLQSKRCNPNGGGGGGGSTPGGGGTGDTDQAALALHGPGSDPNAFIEDREVEQVSGTQSEQLPEEFRDGLEAFFNALDGRN